MKTILITGGTGLIGQEICKQGNVNGYRFIIATRNKNVANKKTGDNVEYIEWNVKNKEIDVDKIKGIDGVIHLAGANIGEKRWTKKRKQELYDSRVASTKFLFDVIKKHKIKISFFIAASAIGFYGTDKIGCIFQEEDKPGDDFLAKLCVDWEKAVEKFNLLGVRTVMLRTGVVFSSKGGALPKMVMPVKYFIGGPIGSGKQIIPWIHIQDMARLYLYAVENVDMQGVYNAVVPIQEQPTNKQLGNKVAQILHRPFVFPAIPEFLLNMLLGEMACIVLKGCYVCNDKLLTTGFTFKYPKLHQSLTHLLRK